MEQSTEKAGSHPPLTGDVTATGAHPALLVGPGPSVLLALFVFTTTLCSGYQRHQLHFTDEETE